jgi:ubiquinone/menaquinone biosynthesis C-methylase UbiE
MARISYDEQTAAAFKAVREVPRDGLSEWREAVRRHLRPSQGMTLVDIGAGTGAFAAAFSDWFDLSVLAVEPSAAMRDQIPRIPAIQVLEGNASVLPLPDESADAAWLSLAIHHIPDLGVAAHEIRRVLRPGAPVLIRQGFPGRYDRVELVRWFPETARTIDTYPSVKDTCEAFAAQDSTRTLLSRFVRRTRPTSPTSSARWTLSATPTPRCAISLRTSSSAVKNVSAVPYDMPRTQRTRKPEATGLTSWFFADRFARKANLDVLPSEARPG